jgi:hypothetical protein
MAAPARVLLSDLPKGHQFPPATFILTAEDVIRYLDAVEDSNTLYLERSLAPPLCVAASALGGLLELLELPPGTLHTGQEIEVRGGVPIGVSLTLTGRIAQRSERGGLVISALDFELTPQGANEPVLTGRTTVLVSGAST